MADQIDIKDLFFKLLKQWKKITLCALVGAIVGIIIAFSIPKEYQSTVVLVPESGKESVSGSMGGLASMMGVSIPGQTNEGINEKLYPEIISSSIFLNDFRNIKVNNEGEQITVFEYITKHNKRPWWSHISSLLSNFASLFSSENKENEEIHYEFSKPSINDVGFELSLKSRIVSEIDKKTSLLSIKVKMQDPQIAAALADSVISNLQFYVQQYKTYKTRANLENSLKMLQQARTDYYKADSLYAKTYDKNINLTAQSAMLKLERLKNEKELAFTVYQQIATQVEDYKIKLQKETPILTIIEPSRVAVQPTSPNKKLIVIAFAFFGLFFISAKIIVKEIFKSDKTAQ